MRLIGVPRLEGEAIEFRLWPRPKGVAHELKARQADELFWRAVCQRTNLALDLPSRERLSLCDVARADNRRAIGYGEKCLRRIDTLHCGLFAC